MDRVFSFFCFQYSHNPPKNKTCRLAKVVSRPTKDQLNAMKNPMAVVMPMAPDHRKIRCKKCIHSRTDGVLFAILSASCDFSMGMYPSKIHVVTCFFSDTNEPLFKMVRIYSIGYRNKDYFLKNIDECHADFDVTCSSLSRKNQDNDILSSSSFVHRIVQLHHCHRTMVVAMITVWMM